MAPAAVDIESPYAANRSAIKNPNPDPFSQGNDDHDRCNVFGNPTELNNQGGARTRSGRARPRLVKVRKQLHGRSTAVLGELGPGFNPFKSVTEDAGCLSNDSGVSASNSCLNEWYMRNNENSAANGGFVFTGNNLGSNEKISSPGRESGGNAEKVKIESFKFGAGNGHSALKAESRELDDRCFVFGATMDDVAVKFNIKNTQHSECGKGSNEGTDFAVNSGGLGFELNMEKPVDGEIKEKLEADNVGHATRHDSDKNEEINGSAFVFGRMDNREAESVGYANCNVSDKNEEINGSAFVFGRMDNREAESVGYATCNVSDKNERITSSSFGFGDSWLKLASDVNEKKRESDETPRNSISSDAQKTKGEKEAVHHGLPYVMRKLTIDDFNNVDGACCEKSSCNIDNMFVFGSKGKTFPSPYGSSTTDHGHNAARVADAYMCPSSNNNKSCDATSSFTEIPAETKFYQGQATGDTHLNRTVVMPSFSSDDCIYQKTCGFAEASTLTQVREENGKTCSATTPSGSGMPFMSLKLPCDPSCFKNSLFTGSNKKSQFSMNGRSKGHKRSEKSRQRLKNRFFMQQPEQECAKNEYVEETLRSPACYSPMDFSPYEATTSAEDSKETSLTSNDANHLKTVLSSLQSTVKDSEVCSDSNAGDGSTANTFNLDTERNHQVLFSFTTGLEDLDGRKFCFSASTPAHGSSSAAKRLHKKKNRKKHPCEPLIASSTNVDKVEEGDPCALQREIAIKSEANEPVTRGPASPTVLVKEACEKWRLRGNQAYQHGDLSKAEDFYTRGISSIPAIEIPRGCLKPLVICYSNRAAARMSLGNLRGALKDCATAATLDPNFSKVHLRSANCHLLLGDTENACGCFDKCLENASGVCLDRRIAVEAADGLQKARKVAECRHRSAKLLEERTSEAAVSALDVIAEALSTSPFSEKLLEMKAECLLMLRKFKEVIHLCEQTLSAAENNFVSVSDNNCFTEIGCSGSEMFSLPKMWRWLLMSKSYFYLGKLEMALNMLQALEQMEPARYKSASKMLESSVTLAVTIRNLLHHKNAGNEAVRSGRYTEAVEHYTGAISSNIESHSFTAICFGNRAASHQALGQIADAIADCSLAIALDGNYAKAVSRRAALYEMIRDYEQAATDLQRLVSILENQTDGKVKQSDTPDRSSSRTKELRQARQHLSLMEKEAKKGIPLDFYRILGVKDSDSASDIKKAYRKAALRHHPDKAGQFLAKSESGDGGQLWKSIIQGVHVDADKLFKMIGEAYAVLSDPIKRSEYDLDEEIRKASKENGGVGSRRKTSSARSHSCERSDHEPNWQGYWKTYGSSHSRW